jgi:hypothetical protein
MYEPRARAQRGRNPLGVEPQGSKGLAPCELDFRGTRSLTSITRDGTGALPKTITARRLTNARQLPRHPEVFTLSDRRRGTRVPRNPGLGRLQGTTVPSSRHIYLRLPHDWRKPRQQWVETTHSAGRMAAPIDEAPQSTSDKGIMWRTASTTPTGQDIFNSVSPRPPHL